MITRRNLKAVNFAYLCSIERDEPFFSLSLPLVAHDLETALKEYFKEQQLENKNALYCPKCKEKVKVKTNNINKRFT